MQERSNVKEVTAQKIFKKGKKCERSCEKVTITFSETHSELAMIISCQEDKDNKRPENHWP